MLDASLISSHLQGVTRHSLLHVSSRESFICFPLPLHLLLLLFIFLFNNNFSRKFSSFLFVICFPPNNLECAFCVFCSLFRLLYHYSFPNATAWFHNYSEAHHVLSRAARLAWKRSKTKTIKWVQRTIEWPTGSHCRRSLKHMFINGGILRPSRPCFYVRSIRFNLICMGAINGSTHFDTFVLKFFPFS